MDAVSKGYLKNMYFGIAQDAAATNLLEVSHGLSTGPQVHSTLYYTLYYSRVYYRVTGLAGH
jgi:hypothetical protein